MLKSLLKDSVIYALPTFVSRGLSLFLVPLYTRVLVPGDYGALDLFMVFAGIVNLTVAMEISQAVARFYTSEKEPLKKISYASTAFWFTIISLFLFCSIVLVFVVPISKFVMGKSGLELIFKIGILHLFLYGLVYLMQNQLRWELRSKSYAILSIVYSIVTTLLSVWLAYYQQTGLVGLMWGMVGGGLITVALGAWQLRCTFKFQFDRTILIEMLRFSIPLVPASIAVWCSSYVDRLMINHYLGLTEVGIFGIGFRLASVVSLIMVGFQMALTPLIYTHHENPETPKEIAKIFRLFISLCLIFFILMNLIAHDLLVIFTQPKFYEAKNVIILLVPSIIFSQIYIFAPGLFIAKKTFYIVWIQVLGAIINFILNLILIPMMSYTGAALATMLSQGLVFVILMFFSQKYYPIPYQWFKIIMAVFFTVLLILGVEQLVNQGLFHFLTIVFALILGFIGLIGVGLIKIIELKEFVLFFQRGFKKIKY